VGEEIESKAIVTFSRAEKAYEQAPRGSAEEVQAMLAMALALHTQALVHHADQLRMASNG